MPRRRVAALCMPPLAVFDPAKQPAHTANAAHESAMPGSWHGQRHRRQRAHSPPACQGKGASSSHPSAQCWEFAGAAWIQSTLNSRCRFHGSSGWKFSPQSVAWGSAGKPLTGCALWAGVQVRTKTVWHVCRPRCLSTMTRTRAAPSSHSPAATRPPSSCRSVWWWCNVWCVCLCLGGA